MLFQCRKKFPVHVVISVLQAFNCQYLEIFVHDIYFYFISLYFKVKTQWNKGTSALVEFWAIYRVSTSIIMVMVGTLYIDQNSPSALIMIMVGSVCKSI